MIYQYQELFLISEFNWLFLPLSLPQTYLSPIFVFSSDLINGVQILLQHLCGTKGIFKVRELPIITQVLVFITSTSSVTRHDPNYQD